ncbi:MAG TPA: hypothetical protein VL588_01240 [Bdellovibrionota bacterium]|nr:hypothetical protein [Bdellovibrionota bacterium]
MIWNVAVVVLSALLISFTSWLAGRSPGLAGFLLSLPLSTLLALPFAQARYEDTDKTVAFARGIFTALPLTLVFFIPFLAAKQLKWPFWGMYASGLVLLAGAYFAHRALIR